jgi:hypothetical protein
VGFEEVVMYRFALLALVVAFSAVASCQSPTPGEVCTDTTGAGLDGMLSTTDFGGGSCGSFDAGTKPGDTCMTGADCTPFCCACPGDAGGASASVGYCYLATDTKPGTCATEEQTCCTFASEEMKDAGQCR